jgi:Flp pilus assembly protein TadG
VRKSQHGRNVPVTGRARALVLRANALIAQDCCGAVAVEFAVLLVPLLLLLVGGTDLGFAMLTETRITFAVEAAAKCGAIGATMCASASETAAYGATVARVRGLDASEFVVVTEPCGVSVTATYPYVGMILPAITLRAGACYPAG